MEVYKEIKGYEGLYEVSNLGNVKSLDRTTKSESGVIRNIKGKNRSKNKSTSGYYYTCLHKKGKRKNWLTHQLVAMAFLNHTPSGLKYVVNHKDFNKLNNNVENLEIVTQRANTNRKHLKSSSKYTGVVKIKNNNKWISQIIVEGNKKYLGIFNNEYDAHLAYQNELSKII